MNDARAQTAGKVWVVGFLGAGNRPSDGAAPSPLRKQLQASGYVEGRDVTYYGVWADTKSERLPKLAADLVARKVDVIVAFGGPAASAASKASVSVPIVVLSAGDVVDTGLVTSLARPNANVTGINDPAAVLSAKRLEILKELVPAAKRVAVLWNADNYAMTLRYREIERAGHVLGITIEPLGVREPDDFDSALTSMNQRRPDALMMITDALTNLNRQRIIDYAATHRIPAMYEFGSVVQSGGLVSYGSDLDESLRVAADYVAKILKGMKPGDLPIEQPNRYFLVINLRTAKAMGLTIPQSLLVRADQAIE